MSSTSSAQYPAPTVPYDDCNLSNCPIADSQLTYDPNLAGNAFFLAVFSFCLVCNLLLGVWYRTWGYLAAMLLGCLSEIIGYVGRLQMHFNPFPRNPFLIYLCCVTVASVFYTAAIYLCLARIVVAYGETLSVFRPRTYTIFFIVCDFISLLLQAGGGAIASLADDLATENIGLHIMQAGLIFQVASLLVFIALCIIFALSCRRHPEILDMRFEALRCSFRFRFFLWTLSIATAAMLTRCAFRVAELSQGFKGSIWFNEVAYMVLEGGSISLCVLLLTVGHVGIAFGGHYREADFKLRVRKADKEEEEAAAVQEHS